MEWDQIATLLHIEEATRGHPTLKVLHDMAMAELQSHAAAASQPQEPPHEEYPNFGRRDSDAA